MSEHEQPPLASSFMQADPKTVTAEMSLDEVTDFLLKNKLSNAPVVSHAHGANLLIGFVSERDCLAAMTQADFYGSPAPEQTVRTIMRSSPICVTPETDLFSVASLLINHGYRHLPVTDQGRLVGIISRRDVLQAVAQFGQRYGQAQLLEKFRPDLSQLINIRYLVPAKK
jgi:CBS domain-containing protein